MAGGKAKSRPVDIEPERPRLLVTEYFETTDEDQEVTLPSPARSR
jgi:hypothetical protein